ncbi:hypothetical protein [Clostridium tyrobutyricum]|uniref:hypothetical protein n=1 Tax=Clostridium tyrobutyricum TaxID=1519 RepID=UPI000ACC2501|nr:hypothetical protein [Clostridium tyrobutyricum]
MIDSTQLLLCGISKAGVRQRRIPFDIVADDSFYSDTNIAYLKKSISHLNHGKGKMHDIVEVENE